MRDLDMARDIITRTTITTSPSSTCRELGRPAVLRPEQGAERIIAERDKKRRPE